MSRTLMTTILCTALLGCQTSTAATPDQSGAQARPAAAAFDSSKAWEHLRQMVMIGPRPSGSEALRQTRAYITRQIASVGLTVEEQPFLAQTPNGPVNMVNLVVRLPGRRTDRILITGHYDTKIFKEFVFVGASDGGSSAAMLIELARVMKSRPHEFTYEFVWFDGEEAVVDWYMKVGNHADNTYGSRYYVQAAQKAGALASIKAMILLDMVGDRDLRIQREERSATWLKDAIWGAARRLGHGAVFVDEETPIEDDHLPFVDAGVPSVDIIDLDYPAWHTAADTLSAVSARSLQIVGDVLLAALPDIEKRLIAGR